jgi:hypothetical protein
VDEHVIDDAEHGRRRANAECQRQHRNGGKARRLAERTDEVPHVVYHPVEPIEVGRVPRLFFEVGHVPESAPGDERRVTTLRVAAAFRVEVEMESQLVVDATFVIAPAEPHTGTVPESIDE